MSPASSTTRTTDPMSPKYTQNTEEAMPGKRASTDQRTWWRAAPTALASIVALLAAMAILLTPSLASADLLGTFDAAVRDADGNDYSQAGGHPYDVFTDMNFHKRDFAGNPVPPDAPGMASPDESVRTIEVDLPAGLLGDPEAVPQCERDRALSGVLRCPVDTQVGIVTLKMFGSESSVPVYNVEPPPGQPAQFAFQPLIPIVFINAHVRPDGGLHMRIPNISQALPLTGTSLVMWGTPADHISEANNPRNAFMTNPTSCTGATTTTIRANSWQDPTFDTLDSVDTNGTTGCEKLPFDPEIDVQVGSSSSDSPTGLAVDVTMPQGDARNPDGLVQAHLEDAVVTLPEGTSVNPSAADGLASCSPSQIGLEHTDRESCPAASKVGTVQITSPLQTEPLTGAIYQADPSDNPFDELIAIYIAAEGGGVRVKLAGEVRRDPATGQIETVIEDAPQLPFSKFSLRFFSGPRAALATPVTCGTKTTSASLGPWSGTASVELQSSFEIDRGPGAIDCAASESDRPFDPTLVAGLVNPTAASSSPLILRASRADGEQEIASIDATMPGGVSAVIAGVPQCATAAAATGDCPEESRIGTLTTKVGAGSSPYRVDGGAAYLAGPYEGAPLSLSIVVPARAGIFDLGEVVVRAAVHVDPRDAHLRVISDPIPQILDGVPLRIRQVAVKIDRPGFTTSPTSCEAKQVSAKIGGASGAVAESSYRFQMAGCEALGFAPNLDLSFGKSKKDTKANAHPELNAKLSFNEGDANIRSVEVALPQGTFLDQDRLGRICSRANYAAETCPKESIVGYAKATTPLLDDPVEGPVYLKASDNTLPDLAADLNGQINIDLFGKIDQKENRKGLNQIRNTFDVVPDVPVSDFELTLEGGDEGLLVNSRNICKSKKAQKVSIDIVAHNEMASSSKPLIGSACDSLNKKKAKKLKAKAKKLLKKAKKADDRSKAKKLLKQAKQLKRQARKLGR